ncbi:sigma-54 dependent transcriptional regulator [Tabrizicola sp. J26]|uniref:sigma-54-dependent transcriptional regulator n=1 Tax=Alitabrizicola rongguiensis TaxID=2909234 RepID=UPI001F1E13DB|nr:sigma-54 dependent transcriptional regulator [Tabrizicola rongguiensis]MCF1709333.1 sigma-54 dependent transcriptional regulator [Tabrizicola rongguiensis]
MSATRATILVVDDEPHSLTSMRMALEDEFDIRTAGDAETALRVLDEDWVQVIFCDQRMPGRTGVEFLTEVRERWPETVRIVITGYTDAGAMVAAINEAGIYQFITKPWHPDQLLMAARNATRLFQLSRENDRMALEMRVLTATAESRVEKRRRALREGLGFETILRAPNSPMNAVVQAARQFASFDVPVLLIGEPGTGKAALARAMHYGSLRSDRPFHSFSLSGLPDDLAMIELFGAKRGILPGGSNKIGLVQKAERGTLYLGGIDSASPALQVALLRLLIEGAFSPAGGQEIIGSNLRLIAGSDRDLRALVAEGRFRADLYYALSVTELELPPLRGRPGDIALHAQAVLMDMASRHGKPVHGFEAAALEFLENYDWPGNLRELSNEVTRMLIFGQGPLLGAELISRAILQAPPGDSGADRSAEAAMTGAGSLKDRIELVEMRILRETLARHRWNKSRAAAEMGLSRVGLRAKLDRYGILQPGRTTADEDEED